MQKKSDAVPFRGKDRKDSLDQFQQPPCKIFKDKDVERQKFLALALFHTVASGHSKLPEILQIVQEEWGPLGVAASGSTIRRVLDNLVARKLLDTNTKVKPYTFAVRTEGKESAQLMLGEVAEICLRTLSEWQDMAKFLEKMLRIFVHLASGGPQREPI